MLGSKAGKTPQSRELTLTLFVYMYKGCTRGAHGTIPPAGPCLQKGAKAGVPSRLRTSRRLGALLALPPGWGGRVQMCPSADGGPGRPNRKSPIAQETGAGLGRLGRRAGVLYAVSQWKAY